MNQKAIERQRQRSTWRRGTTLVEFAITCPLLFLFMFSAIEICRVNMLRHTVETAAYESCRRGIVPGASAAEVVSVANTALGAVSTRGATVQVIPAQIMPYTTQVTVTIDVPIQANSWLGPVLFRGRRVLTTCTLERERDGSNVVQ